MQEVNETNSAQTDVERQGLAFAQSLQNGLVNNALALGLGATIWGLSRRARAAANGHTAQTAYFGANPGNGAIQIPGSGDIQVLNYALALEDLESNLYIQAIARLTNGGTSGTGTSYAGLGVTSGADLNYLNVFAQVEADHAAFIRNAITTAGSIPIPKFNYDFGMENLDRPGVLQLVYAAELTGVTAYTGVIPSFTTGNYLPVAAAILGTEARHTAVLAILLNQMYGTNISTAPQFNENSGKELPLTPDQVLFQGGTTNPSLTYPAGGQIKPVTGASGFIFN